jgi:glutamine synthetase
MNEMGWGNYANDHEDANGQFEQNIAYADALTTADRVITTRYLISVLAEQRDMVATFMPKPFGDRTGLGARPLPDGVLREEHRLCAGSSASTCATPG